jgi:hypothetical protein
MYQIGVEKDKYFMGGECKDPLIDLQYFFGYLGTSLTRRE